MDKKREKKGRLSFGLDLATSLTVRIYVPQSSKAVPGWSPVNRWFTMSDGLVYKKYNQKNTTIQNTLVNIKNKEKYRNTKPQSS